MISAYFWCGAFLVCAAFDGTIHAPAIAAEEAGGRVAVEIAFAAEWIFAAHFCDANQIAGAIFIACARLWLIWFDAGFRTTDFTIGAVFVAFTAVILWFGAFTGFADEIALALFIAVALFRWGFIDAIAVFANFVAHALVIVLAIFALWGFDACFLRTGIEFGAFIFGLTRFVASILFACTGFTDAGSGALVACFAFLLALWLADLVSANVRAGTIVIDVAF